MQIERSKLGIRPLGISIAGQGVMGRRMRSAIESRNDMHVTGVYDPALTNDLAGQGVSTVEALLDLPDTDCIYIASPPNSHLALIEQAVRKGLAIFCEKPLAASRAEVDACLAAVSGATLPAAVNFPFASADAVVRLERLLANGRLGAVQGVEVELAFSAWPRGWQAGAAPWLSSSREGGFMREVGSHFLWLAQRLFGGGVLQSHRVERGANGLETSVVAEFDFSGTPLRLDGKIGGPDEDYNRFRVKGSRSEASLTDWYRLVAEGESDCRTPPLDSQLDELARLLTTGQSRLSSFDEAAGVAHLVEQILE